MLTLNKYYKISEDVRTEEEFPQTGLIVGSYDFKNVTDFVINGVSITPDALSTTTIAFGCSNHIIANPVLNYYVSGNLIVQIISPTDTFSFVGLVDAKSGNDDLLQFVQDNKYFKAKLVIPIGLYEYSGETNLVDKSSSSILSLVARVFGTFREEIDILNPSLMLEYPDLPDFNYVYIASLKRFYFVTSIVSVRFGVWRIGLHVDVLFSYASDIQAQECFVLRNANAYDDSLADERYPVSTYFTRSVYDVNVSYPTPAIDNVANVTFDQTTNGSEERWVVSALNDTHAQTYHNEVTAPTDSNLPDIANVRPCASVGNSNVLYAMTETECAYFCNAIRKRSDLASYVISCCYYPFSVSSISQYTFGNYVWIGDEQLHSSNQGEFKTSTGATSVTSDIIYNMGYVIIADFNYTATDSFKIREPICYYELFIPFVGWVKFNAEDIINKRILVYYAIDVDSGMATAYVKQYSVDAPIFSATCQVGIRLPINTTNEEQITRQKQNNVLNLAVGLTGASVSTAIGIASGNPIGTIGGVLSGTKTIASSVNANNLLFDTAQTSLFSSETSLYGNISKVLLRVTERSSVDNFDQSVFLKTQGGLSKTYMSLSGLSGYTEIPEMEYKPSSYKYITKTEIDEILTLARNGIIL